MSDETTLLKAENAELKAENAKLRERIHKLEMEGSDHFYRMAYAEDANRTLEAENAKLREELAKARDPQRIGGQADPSSFVYAIEQLREFRWQHATNDDDAIPYINNVADAHERENAKLRELVRDMWHEGAFAPGACYVETDRLEERTRELGIEVE